MSAAGRGAPDPDLYRLLGVPREASREEIAQAWRRRARAEHPDARPRDATAPDRFRVLAQAYQILGDPARRAAYDRALGTGPAGPGEQVPVVRVAAPSPAGPGARPPARVPGPPRWVGPVRVQSPQRAAAGGWDEQEARLAVLALWYVARERDRPW